MIILVTGSRDWTDRAAIYEALDEARGDTPHERMLLVHGGADGADTIAKHYGEAMDWGVQEHRAQWAVYGRKAGPLRNVEMVDFVVARRQLEPIKVLAFIKDNSPGATHCATYAEACGLPVRYYRP